MKLEIQDESGILHTIIEDISRLDLEDITVIREVVREIRMVRRTIQQEKNNGRQEG